MISCIAIIGAANNPLYIKTFEDEDDLEFQYIAHVSLDMIEEKLRSAKQLGIKEDTYLGFLGPIEDYRVYAYVTNTSIKFVSIMQNPPLRESDLRTFFAEVHKLYINAIANPFATIGARIISPLFEKTMNQLVLRYSTTS